MAGLIQFIANKFGPLVTLNVSPQDPLPVTVYAPAASTGITPVVAQGGSGTKTVAAAATPEALVADSTLVESVTIYALAANTGDAFAGFSSDPQGALPLVIVAPAGKKIDLAEILVRVTEDGDGVAYETID
jgi:hypothetical protein